MLALLVQQDANNIKSTHKLGSAKTNPHLAARLLYEPAGELDDEADGPVDFFEPQELIIE